MQTGGPDRKSGWTVILLKVLDSAGSEVVSLRRAEVDSTDTIL